MKYHYQKYQYPKGDCFRTCLACILNKEDVEDIPNFMKNGEEYFDDLFFLWLDMNNYQYIEVSRKEWEKQWYIPEGICTVIIKNAQHPHGHSVIAKSYSKDNLKYLEFLHNPQKGFDCNNIKIEDVVSIGFLSIKLIEKEIL